ncbi:unnamed protein product [Gordionus sp. m RMFG-2023]|uniref:alpha-1A adrenergic receptor-like n=1 Tax=Gordionus sp. m RMFG-2023 TaxID=3053472 RepID=UPI0030E2C5D7
MRYIEFDKNFIYNYTFLAEYHKDYDSLVERRGLTIGLLTLLTLYIMIGLLGNIAIIGAIYSKKLLWKPLNIFIINLSLADLIEVTLISATSITGLTIGHQVFLQNHVLCSVIANVCVTSCLVSILTHATIAITRYLSIRYHATFVDNARWKSTIITCILIWIMAFMLQISPNVGWGRNVYDLKAMICIWDRTYSIGYTLYFSVVYVYVPMITIFYFYVMLFLHVRKVRQGLETHEKHHFQENCKDTKSNIGIPAPKPTNPLYFKAHVSMSKRRLNQELKLARTLFAHFGLVFLLWGQYTLILICDYRNELPATVHASTVQVAHSIAVLNVFIYISNSLFRSGMIEFLIQKPIKLILVGMGIKQDVPTKISLQTFESSIKTK